MKDHIELTTWEEIAGAQKPIATDKEGASLSVRRAIHSDAWLISLPSRGGAVKVAVCEETFPILRYAFRFWKRREPLRWEGEPRVCLRDGEATPYCYLGSIPQELVGQRVKVTIEELPATGDDAGRG